MHSRCSKTAFVLGNGVSRLKVNAADLHVHGTVYGCNALYRELEPDYLVAVDVKMVNEIVLSGYHLTHQVWTNPNQGIVNERNLNFFKPHRGWSSGPTALWLCSDHSPQHVYILGFDYQGLNGKINNVYADTYNYRKSSDPATYHGNWLKQTQQVIQEFPHVKYTRVVDKISEFLPDSLKKENLPNLEHIEISEFNQIFNLDK